MSRAQQLARQIAANRPAVAVRQGVTVGAPVDGVVQVEAAGVRLPVEVPGSLRRTVQDGQQVTYSARGSKRVVEAILTPLSLPTISALPGTASGSSADADTEGTTSSGAYDWTDGSQLGTYAADIAEVTRYLAGDINTLRQVLNWHAGDINANRDAINALITGHNAMRNVLDQLVTGLREQGFIS